ncbi:MAG: ATP-binding protein [Ignavibacteriales bacterium]
MNDFFNHNEHKTNRLLINSCWAIIVIGYFIMYLSAVYGQVNFTHTILFVIVCISIFINLALEFLYFLAKKKNKTLPILKYLVIFSFTFNLNSILILSHASMAPEIIITNIMVAILYYQIPIIYFTIFINSLALLLFILINKIILIQNFSTYFYLVIFLFLFYILTGYLRRLTNIVSSLKQHEQKLIEKNEEIQSAYDKLEFEQQKVDKLNNELIDNNKVLLDAFNELTIKQQEIVALNQGLLDSNTKLETAYSELNLQQEEMTALNQELMATNEAMRRAINELSLKQKEIISLNQGLTESNQNLEKAYNELRQAETQLVQQEKMASLGQLSAGLAHEINTPMGAIACNVDISKNIISQIKSQISETDFPEIYNLLIKLEDLNQVNIMACQRIVKIVKSLKSFARLDDEDWLTETDLNKDIENSLILLNSRITENVKIIRDFSDIPIVSCIGSQINQVIMNLLVNALDAINGSGIISISTYVEENWVCISIKDTGIGIKPEHINKIFNPGFTTKGVGVGTGLGLAITYNIVQKHNGCIEVKSEHNKGSDFTVKLPLEIQQSSSDINSATDQNTEAS